MNKPKPIETTNPDWITIEGRFKIMRRRTGTEKWDFWCEDNDIAVMNTRFWTMVDILNKDSSKWDAVQLIQMGKVDKALSSALCGNAAKELVAGILPAEAP